MVERIVVDKIVYDDALEVCSMLVKAFEVKNLPGVFASVKIAIAVQDRLSKLKEV